MYSSPRCICFIILCFVSTLAFSQNSVHRSEAWTAQWSVDKVFNDNGYTLLSGPFLFQVSKFSGNGVPVDALTGKTDFSWPTINGMVFCALEDGQGGWFVGGSFSYVDTVKVSNLVHIKGDKTVDRNWKPNPTGTVRALTKHNSTLYVGGHFTKIFNQTRNYIASLDLINGGLNEWNGNANGIVYVLEVSNNLLYAGGGFTSIGGQTRSRLAALDLTNGTANAWAPAVNNTVYALTVHSTSNSVFIGGAFTSAGGSARTALARLATDSNDGLATAWTANLNAGAIVRKLILQGNALFVGGEYNLIGGNQRYGIAAVDITKNTANILSWNPELQNGNYVYSMGILGNTLYMCGYFDSVNGIFTPGLAAVTTTDATLLENWNPLPNSDVYTIAPGNGAVFLGGDFNGVNAERRENIAIFKDATDELLPHDISLRGGAINAMAVKGNILYIGGDFLFVNNTDRRKLAAIDLTTGQLTSWNPAVSGVSSTDEAIVHSIKIKDDVLIVGGKFFNITTGSTTYQRSNLAAINLSTGVPTTWKPVIGDGLSTSQFVRTVDVSNNIVYVGGEFWTVNGSSRSALASIDGASGAVLAWAPQVPQGAVSKLIVAGNTVYVKGNFPVTVGGQVRSSGMAALDITSGNATPWNPTVVGGSINDFAISTNGLFIGGDFVGIDSHERSYLASFDLNTGEVSNWTGDVRRNGEAIPQITSISASPYRVYVGGWFEYLGYENRYSYAEYDRCPTSATITLSGSTLTAPEASSYQWYENDVLIQGATSRTYQINILEYGRYAVQLVSNGCSIRSDDFIYLITGNEQEKTDSPKIYPNPSRDFFTIEVTDNAVVAIYDMMGKPVHTMNLSPDKHIIETAGWHTGTYVAIVRVNGKIHSQKIIKTF